MGVSKLLQSRSFTIYCNQIPKFCKVFLGSKFRASENTQVLSYINWNMNMLEQKWEKFEHARKATLVGDIRAQPWRSWIFGYQGMVRYVGCSDCIWTGFKI